MTVTFERAALKFSDVFPANAQLSRVERLQPRGDADLVTRAKVIRTHTRSSDAVCRSWLPASACTSQP